MQQTWAVLKRLYSLLRHSFLFLWKELNSTRFCWIALHYFHCIVSGIAGRSPIQLALLLWRASVSNECTRLELITSPMEACSILFCKSPWRSDKCRSGTAANYCLVNTWMFEKPNRNSVIMGTELRPWRLLD